MKREMRILGDESPSAEPPGNPLDTLGLFRCGGEESGGGRAGQEGKKVGWIVVPKDGALRADAEGGCGEAAQKLFGLRSLLKVRCPSAGVRGAVLRLCAQTLLPRGGGRSISPCGFHGGRR